MFHRNGSLDYPPLDHRHFQFHRVYNTEITRIHHPIFDPRHESKDFHEDRLLLSLLFVVES